MNSKQSYRASRLTLKNLARCNVPVTAPKKSADGAPVCQALSSEHAASLALFFGRLRQANIENFFHPHPLTSEEAVARANYSGQDFYCVMLQENEVIGYGMLRGWDEGYAVPSLGIALDPSIRGRGYGRLLMDYLRDAAKKRGVTRIRLKVDPRNSPAIELYRSLGYALEEQEDQQLIGFLSLASDDSRKDA